MNRHVVFSYIDFMAWSWGMGIDVQLQLVITQQFILLWTGRGIGTETCGWRMCLPLVTQVWVQKLGLITLDQLECFITYLKLLKDVENSWRIHRKFQFQESGIRNHLLEESYSTCNWQKNTLSFIAYIDVGCWKKSVCLEATHIN